MSSTDRIVVADVLIYTPILVIEIYEILFWFCRSHIEAILCYGSEIRCISHCDFKFNIMCMVIDIHMKFRKVSSMVYTAFFDYLAYGVSHQHFDKFRIAMVIDTKTQHTSTIINRTDGTEFNHNH